MKEAKILILRPRHINYRLFQQLVMMHEDLFAREHGLRTPEELPWWLQPGVPKPESY